MLDALPPLRGSQVSLDNAFLACELCQNHHMTDRDGSMPI